ncbi:peptidoglycan DD-metalloendopeptidase family protein [Sulfurimonas diazotrophicus]|uniref:Peptidoglycan DD-metalloendopeptidase family protein n=1 Tax=Sulfurimonas diazotrophicus TaxID=3131939 RepID=A0ABZ3HAX7_9BACT
MVRVFWLLLAPLVLLASSVETYKWSEGESYLMFLERLHLPQALYYDIDSDDQKLTEELRTGMPYQVMHDSNGTIEQVLIPVSDELQLHLYRKAGTFAFEAIPVIASTKQESITLSIENSPYYDILKATGSRSLAHAFVAGFKNSLNFRRDLRKGDRLVMVYTQKYRLGSPFGMPELKVGMIEMRGKRHSVYLNSDERYYDEKGRQVEGFLLSRPVRNGRVSSGFTLRRYHPILKRYRAHLGVDYAAPRGTPIVAAGSGTVIFAGRTRGYGKLIKIRHSDGYVTLYAHQKAFRRGIHSGMRVKQGQVIGYVGSTGLSTGPHLHFGLYKNGRAINPARVVQVTTKQLGGKALKAFKGRMASLDTQVEEVLAHPTEAVKVETIDNACYIDPESCRPLKGGKINETHQ